MLKLKFGVKIKNLKPEILLGILVVKSVFDKHHVDTVITEITGGKHMDKSLHYAGQAVDIRSKHISTPTLKKVLLEECREALGRDFDMILEAENEINEHYHIEYQPE